MKLLYIKNFLLKKFDSIGFDRRLLDSLLSKFAALLGELPGLKPKLQVMWDRLKILRERFASSPLTLISTMVTIISIVIGIYQFKVIPKYIEDSQASFKDVLKDVYKEHYQVEINTLKENNEELIYDVSELRVRLEIERKHGGSKALLDSLQHEIKYKEQVIEVYKYKVYSLEQSLRIAYALIDNQSITADLFDYESSIDSLDIFASLDDALNRIDTLRVQLFETRNELNRSKFEVKTVQKENQSKQHVIVTLQSNLGATKTSFDSIESVNKELIHRFTSNIVTLSSASKEISDTEIQKIVKFNRFFHMQFNPGFDGFQNKFTVIKIDKDVVIVDSTTGLVWQKSGSRKTSDTRSRVDDWIETLNRSGYAGHNDWRIPTLEEGLSLLESSKTSGGRFGFGKKLYINDIFDTRQFVIWTSDYPYENISSMDRKYYSIDFKRGIHSVYPGVITEYDSKKKKSMKRISATPYVRAVRNDRKGMTNK